MPQQPIESASKTKKKNKPKRGDVVSLEIEKLTFGGKGLARLDGQYVVFTPYTAPGDKIEAKITNRKSKYAEAKIENFSERAENRIEPVCPLFTKCGGCSWQHLAIEDQLIWKKRIVEESLHRVKSMQSEELIIEDVAACPEPFHYRNKMEFTFGQEAADQPVKIGFHMPGNWKHILDVEKCWLMPEQLNALLDYFRDYAAKNNFDAWNPVKHEGMMRQLLIRWSVEEQKVLVALLTGKKSGLNFEHLANDLMEKLPFVSGFIWGLNANRSDVARAEDILETKGELTLTEKLGDKQFRISLASFFQTNTRGAEILYQTTNDYLSLTGNEILLDAYCGTGSIGLFCSDGASEIVGIEIIKDAIWDARKNAQLNDIQNCTFLAGDMAQTMPIVRQSMKKRFNRLVVDPPRAGMEKRALKQLLELDVPLFVYVSCNPTTMARDLEMVVDAGYVVERVRPVDMFPQTYHIECVTRCVRRSN